MTAFQRVKARWFFGIVMSLGLFMTAHAAPGDKEIESLRQAWAVAKYQTPKNKQLNEYESLIKTAEQYQKRFPTNPGILTWYGTILSSYSAAKGGMGALPYVKKARALLEQAIKINSRVENGFAHSVLGAVYARVPGWPIAFGNDKQARIHLQTALKMNPRGIDANYYYGDFLIEEGEYEAAKQHLDIANRAPIRAGYEIQDRGRKHEIAQSLAQLKRHTR